MGIIMDLFDGSVYPYEQVVPRSEAYRKLRREIADLSRELQKELNSEEYDSFTFRFKKILRQSGLPENLNVHSLRHTNASLLIAQGVDVRTVASLLGHSRASTTLVVYTHASGKKNGTPGRSRVR